MRRRRKDSSEQYAISWKNFFRHGFVINGFLLSGVFIVTVGWIVAYQIDKSNREQTKAVAQYNLMLSRAQVTSSYFPYLLSGDSIKVNLALTILKEIYGENWAIMVGNATGDSANILSSLQNFASQSRDTTLQEVVRVERKKRGRETVIMNLSGMRNSFEKYDILRDKRTLYCNLKVSKPIAQLKIDWGNGWEEIKDLPGSYSQDSKWYFYAVSKSIGTLGLKNVRVELVFEDSNEKYYQQSRVYVQSM